MSEKKILNKKFKSLLSQSSGIIIINYNNRNRECSRELGARLSAQYFMRILTLNLPTSKFQMNTIPTLQARTLGFSKLE